MTLALLITVSALLKIARWAVPALIATFLVSRAMEGGRHRA